MRLIHALGFFCLAASHILLSGIANAGDACERYQATGYVHPTEDDDKDPSSAPSGITPQQGQIPLFNECLKHERDGHFLELTKCLNELDRSLDYFGDLPLVTTLFGKKLRRPVGFRSGDFPLASSSKLLRARMALQLNRPEEALKLVQKADRCIVSSATGQALPGTGLLSGEKSEEEKTAEEQRAAFLSNPFNEGDKITRKIRFAEILAKAYIQLGDRQNANKMIRETPNKYRKW